MTRAAAKKAWAKRTRRKPAPKVKQRIFPTLAQIRAMSPEERKRAIRSIKAFEARWGYMGTSH